jgi:hypothetical protein
METSELVAAVRAELGKLDSTNIVDIDDADIIRESEYILQRINAEIPKRVPRSVLAVANQREYSVETTTLRIQAIIPDADLPEEDRIKLGSYIVNEGSAAEDYNFPSLWTIKMLRRKRGLRDIWFEFNPIERKLKIDPVPSDADAGKKIWYISVESAGWTLASTPAEFNEIVTEGTAWKCMHITFLRRSGEGGILREGGRVDYPASALKTFADEFKKQFFEDLELKRRIYSL